MMLWRQLQKTIFFLSYLVFPFLVYVVWQILLYPTNLLVWSGLLLSMVFFYARFVEPARIVVRKEQLKGRSGGVPMRLAIVSDLHLGVFKGQRFLRRILEKIMAENPDLLLIPGDLINDPTKEELANNFLPLAELEIPVFAVTGNHDAKKPGYYHSEEVREAVKNFLKPMDNVVEYFEKNGRKLRIFGLSDLMEGKSDYGILEGMTDDDFNLVMAHNPDQAHQLAEHLPIDLVVSGHTHAGQIKLPPISNWLIPCKYKFVRGWYEVKGKPVYVSSGAGEVILPMRFLIPPEVVIMEIII